MLAWHDNPPILGPNEDALGSQDGCWWVAHTKSRSEKAFAWDLHERHISYFLPMVERLTFSGGRRRRGMEPLFPSYVFFCGTAEQRSVALATQRLCQVIAVHDQNRLLNELSAVALALREPGTLARYPFIAVGRTCRVARGPLQGLQGVVVQCGRSTRLVLQVSILGQSVAVDIEAALLEQAA